MRKWLRQNDKLKKSSNDKFHILQWTLPAFKVKQGKFAGDVTCPFAGSCGHAGGCYALQGAYVWGPVVDSHTLNYELSKSDEFVDILSKEIRTAAKRLKRAGKQLVVRIHDSGDYYSLDYLKKWLTIMNQNPEVIFYSYTKAVKLMQGLEKQSVLPTNFIVIFSEGGTQDSHIKGRHSRVFESAEALQAEGYDDGSHDDKVAFLSKTGKIGLIYHGASSKQWTTNKGE